MHATDSLAAALGSLAGILDRMGVRYLVGGSLASSAWGLMRATADVDLVAQMLPAQAPELATALGAAWYADPAAIASALRDGRSFNLIHMTSGLKVDVFPPTREFHLEELGRATRETLRLPDGVVVCPVATAEDILLAKLVWFRMGAEASERQWQDIAGLAGVRSDLDTAYLHRWAGQLGVADLLVRALAATG